MIVATDLNIKGIIRFRLVSEIVNKAAIVTCYGTYWGIKYEHNGRIKNVPNYIGCLEHLKKRGW